MSNYVTNMEWYRAFYWAARTGSLSKAAEELYITQPAVTHAIKQLEGQLACRLFFRTSKGVKLTEEGDVLMRHVEQAFHLIQSGERSLADRNALLEGNMRIGASDTLCKYYLLPRLREFHERYPGIQFQVTNRTTPETVQLLKEGKIDFGIVNLPLDDRRLHIRESTELEDVFVARPDMAETVLATTDRKGVSWAQLAEYPLLMLERGSRTRMYVDTVAAAHGVMLKPSMELGSLDLLCEFARTGLGIACVVRNFVEQELASGELVEVKLEERMPTRRIGVATLPQVPLSKAGEAFIAMLP
ncbi:transcriptional regulator, LysR family [Paenibacillus curdlanolyticus YK9]|uniref:Transcriptional regulator, LysR family n=1 Tax=Paenibacillus curdlanolyticus YK9 TaxID=717606 RepID=E0IDA1_9BACL|nr:LysR family transcriptional regulator [Paenibacillus curdlanolyticus]EFM09556.1 transcriptional regulator, LysR family [Paenibacillus curdlanolyticus YK9]